VLALVGTLKVLVERIKHLEDRIARAVRAHPDGELFLSLFRSPNSTLTAASLVAHIGDRRERYPTNEALAAAAGMSPVAVESGKRKVASFRRACDKRLRRAVAPWRRARAITTGGRKTSTEERGKEAAITPTLSASLGGRG
jgi:transposase